MQQHNAQKCEKAHMDAAEVHEARTQKVKSHIVTVRSLHSFIAPYSPTLEPSALLWASHVHLLYRQTHLLDKLHDEEDATRLLLEQHVLEDLGFKMIYELGVHLGLYDSDNENDCEIIFMVEILYVQQTFRMRLLTPC